jgi:hypothetical protein
MIMKVAVLSRFIVTKDILENSFKKVFKSTGLNLNTFTCKMIGRCSVQEKDEITNLWYEDETARVVQDVDIIITHTAPIPKKFFQC